MTQTKVTTAIWPGTLIVYTIAFTSLLLGALIYMLLRPAPVLFINWIELLSLKQLPHISKSSNLLLYISLPHWFVFSLPNGLWTFAYALIMTQIWGGKKLKISYFWLGTIPVLCASYESLQYLEFDSRNFLPL